MVFEISKNDLNFAIGAVAGFLTNHFTRYLSLDGMPAIQFRDKADNYVWGFGVNNGITLGAGAGLYVGGKYLMKKGGEKGETLKQMGKGWLFYFVMEKFLVEPMQYMYVVYHPPGLTGSVIPLAKPLSQTPQNMTRTVMPITTPMATSKYTITA